MSLSGEFDVAGRKQELVIGANWQDVDGSSYKQKNLTLDVTTFDIQNFDPSRVAEPAEPPFWGDVYSALDKARTASTEPALGAHALAALDAGVAREQFRIPPRLSQL